MTINEKTVFLAERQGKMEVWSLHELEGLAEALGRQSEWAAVDGENFEALAWDMIDQATNKNGGGEMEKISWKDIVLYDEDEREYSYPDHVFIEQMIELYKGNAIDLLFPEEEGVEPHDWGNATIRNIDWTGIEG